LTSNLQQICYTVNIYNKTLN